MSTSTVVLAGALLALGAGVLPAAQNTLTRKEQSEGFQLLFDGKTMRGWRDPAKEVPPGDSWLIEDGCLKTRLHPRIAEDLITADSYRDFDLKFDWRVSPGGNTGLKYRVQRTVFLDETKIQKGPGGFEGQLGREMAHPVSDRARLSPGATGFEYTVAFEMQLIDDQRHPDARRDASHKTGALYSFLAPNSYPAHPAGEWNQSRLIVKGDHFEHWINGEKVLEGSLKDPAIRSGAEKRWAKYTPGVFQALTHPKPEGPICLQHHGDVVWFRNLKIRRLDTH
ncbi:MAG: DUF1080 domain-containing protein [Acidobacteria bacterium]|nr:DUF1080 domain-containing protein [Acidobacteriota bacterium]